MWFGFYHGRITILLPYKLDSDYAADSDQEYRKTRRSVRTSIDRSVQRDLVSVLCNWWS